MVYVIAALVAGLVAVEIGVPVLRHGLLGAVCPVGDPPALSRAAGRPDALTLAPTVEALSGPPVASSPIHFSEL